MSFFRQAIAVALTAALAAEPAFTAVPGSGFLVSRYQDLTRNSELGTRNMFFASQALALFRAGRLPGPANGKVAELAWEKSGWAPRQSPSKPRLRLASLALLAAGNLILTGCAAVLNPASVAVPALQRSFFQAEPDALAVLRDPKASAGALEALLNRPDILGLLKSDPAAVQRLGKWLHSVLAAAYGNKAAGARSHLPDGILRTLGLLLPMDEARSALERAQSDLISFSEPLRAKKKLSQAETRRLKEIIEHLRRVSQMLEPLKSARTLWEPLWVLLTAGVVGIFSRRSPAPSKSARVIVKSDKVLDQSIDYFIYEDKGAALAYFVLCPMARTGEVLEFIRGFKEVHLPLGLMSPYRKAREALRATKLLLLPDHDFKVPKDAPEFQALYSEIKAFTAAWMYEAELQAGKSPSEAEDAARAGVLYTVTPVTLAWARRLLGFSGGDPSAGAVAPAAPTGALGAATDYLFRAKNSPARRSA